MDIVTLKAQLRDTAGKGPARSLRRTGRVPAVLYGSDTDTLSLSIDAHELELMFHSPKYSRGLINLTVESGQPVEKTVMIKELQTDPIKQDFIHVDFYEIKMDKKIHTTASVVLTGTAKGVEDGGILQLIRRELDIYCLPTDIPEQIEIDVTDLDIGESVHVEDVQPASGIEIPFDTNFTIATVVSPRMEEEEEVAEEEEGAEGEEGEEAAEESSGESE